jgi:hypothetical protein
MTDATTTDTWTDPTTGLECRIVQQGLGYLCGYVALPDNTEHPWHSLGATDDQLWNVDVHGGVTYAEDRFPLSQQSDGWVLGFDCAHYDDAYRPDDTNGTYRTPEYVRAECTKLAQQIADAAAREEA